MPGALARWRPGAPGDSPILFDFLRANTVSRLKYAQCTFVRETTCHHGAELAEA